MNFAGYLNSRNRPEMLRQCIRQFFGLAAQPDLVELLVRLDDDDKASDRVVEEEKAGRNLRVWRGARPKNLIASGNAIARQARGQYIFALNDDAHIITKNWDSVILDKITKFKAENQIKDDIIYCYTECDSVDKDRSRGYSNFPVISKQASDVLGWTMPEDFVGLGADNATHLLYACINRVVDVSSVKIHHVFHSTLQKVLEPDDTAQGMRGISQANHVDPYTWSNQAGVKKLQEFIKNSKK